MDRAATLVVEMTRIYLDHAATSPIRPEVLDVMRVVALEAPWNPSSPHAEGRRARAILDEARATVGDLLGARPREIVFTASGSEADNLAILGVARALGDGAHHAITVATEHRAVLHAFDVLRDAGWSVTVLPVDGEGRVDVDGFIDALRPQTRLASIALVNNELGVVAPVARLAAIARERGVLVHTDAVQAAGLLLLDVRALDVDLLSISAHKLGGPPGVGALVIRGACALAARIVGGGQEAGRRAGTENVAGIAGLALALALAHAERADVAPRVAARRRSLERGLLAALAGARVNAAAAPRAPHIASVAVGDVDGQALLARLDLAGIAASLGSACTSGALEPSHVIRALDAPSWVEGGTVRFSLGRETTEEMIASALVRVPEVVEAVREREA